MKTKILILICTLALLSMNKPENTRLNKFVIMRSFDGEEYLYNITMQNGEIKKELNSDQIMEILCPDCYDITEH